MRGTVAAATAIVAGKVALAAATPDPAEPAARAEVDAMVGGKDDEGDDDVNEVEFAPRRLAAASSVLRSSMAISASAGFART